MRRIAVLFEPDALDLRQRETVRGVARYAKGHGDWQVSLEPHGHLAEAGTFDGVLAAAYWGRGPALLSLACPVVMVTWGNRDQPALRVAENRAGGGRMAARHLADAGCKAFAYLGFTKQVESMHQWAAFRKELGRDMKVIGTGGLVDLIAAETDAIQIKAPWLTLDGLRLIWEMNQN